MGSGHSPTSAVSVSWPPAPRHAVGARSFPEGAPGLKEASQRVAGEGNTPRRRVDGSHLGRHDRLVRSVRPLALGSGVTLAASVLLGAYALGVRYATGGWGAFTDPWRVAIELWLGVVLGVATAVAVSATRATARDINALAPALALAQERLAAEMPGVTGVHGRGFWIWTVGWAVLAFGVTYGLGPLPLFIDTELGQARTTFDPMLPWACARNAALAGALFGAAWIEVALSSRVGRFVGEYAVVDLVDRQLYSPLGRRARRNVLAWAFLSVFSSFLFYVVVFATVVLPVRQLRKRLEVEKQAQLAQLRDQIRVHAGHLLAGKTEPGPSLADLHAYEQRLASTGTWVYETSTLVRTGLYALIVAGSWVGAALVERALDLIVR